MRAEPELPEKAVYAGLMSSGKPRSPHLSPLAGTREEARARAEQLGLTWEIVAKKRDWKALSSALDAYAAGADSADLYPPPIRRDGPVISDAIRFAGKLVRLDTTKLTITREDLVDISDLAQLKKLKYLDLLRTAVRDLTPLAGLTDLENLDISDTKVADLGPLAALTRLRRLSASTTLVSSLSPLANLVELESLWLYSTEVTDITALANLPRLKTLALGLNVHERDPSSPPSVSDITPLAGLRNLELLYLTGTTVTDLSPLAKLANLKKLFLYGVELPAATVAKLQKALPTTQFFGP
jgi:hypothetical protein